MQHLVDMYFLPIDDPEATVDGTEAVVTLAALTRVQAIAVVKVPANLSGQDRESLLQFLYEETSGEDFIDEDYDFWEEGSHTLEYLLEESNDE